MKKAIKKLILKFLLKRGYKIISAKNGQEYLSYTVLNENFNNLSKCYELLFSKQFGTLSSNEKRIDLLKGLLGTPPSEAYFLVEGLTRTKLVPGDICEFGVAQGITSQLIANEIIDSSDRFLHLFDSFQGLPKPSSKDTLKDDIFNLGNIEAYEGQMKVPEEEVLAKLEDLNFPKSRFKIHKGFIENLLSSKDQFPELVSFAYVDFDFYEPIKLILDFLDGVTKKGSVIIVDDYDFFSTGAKVAVDEFLKNKKEKYQLYIPEKIFGCFAVLTKIQS